MSYESMLMNVQERLLVKRNQFNNCIDPELTGILVKHITLLEEYQSYYIKKIKQERKELQAI